MTMRSSLARRRAAARASRDSGDSGAVLIEFVLVFPLLLMLCCVILEFGWWIHTYNIVDQSARQGARQAAIDGAISSDASTAARDMALGSGLRADRLTFTGSVDTRTQTVESGQNFGLRCAYLDGSRMQVEVNYDHQLLFPFLRSPLFFGVGNVIGDVVGSATLPTEIIWISGNGPRLSNGTLTRC